MNTLLGEKIKIAKTLLCAQRDKEVFRISNREKCIAIIDSFDESQLGGIANILQAAKNAIEESIDDAFCLRLYEEYLQDEDNGETVSFEEAAQMLGVSL